VFGALVQRKQSDRDELVFESEGPLTISGEDGDVTIRVGSEGRLLASRSVAVSLEDAAATAVYASECSGEPAAFVWHAGARSALVPVDPDIERRLRELGYIR